MIYLILAIVCSSAISLLMRFSDRYAKNNFVMFAANYITCGLLSLLFLVLDDGDAILPIGSVTAGEMTFAVGLGIVSGILFLLAFMLLQFNIRKNGVTLASTFMKLGVVVPVMMSVAFRWDDPTVLQFVGCALAIAAIIIINGESSEAGDGIGKTGSEADAVGKNGRGGQGAGKRGTAVAGAKMSGSRAGLWLVVLLLTGGVTDSMSNVYDKLGSPDLKNQYLLFIFIAASIFSIICAVARRQHVTGADIFWGVIIGIPNYFSARFLLYALAEVPAIVAYPVYNISVILTISLLSFLIFKEMLSRRKLFGMAVIIAAILVLNL